MKYAIPVLVVAGCVVGLWHVIRRRRFVRFEVGSPAWKKVVMTVAAMVVGLFAANASAQEKPESHPTCYAAIEKLPSVEEQVNETRANLLKRIRSLERLLQDGKLTEEAYRVTLDTIRQTLEKVESGDTYEAHLEVLLVAEKRIVALRRELDSTWLKEVKSQDSWPVLRNQWKQLVARLEGDPNTLDVKAVDDALESLKAAGLVEGTTVQAVSMLFDDVRHHYDRSHSGKTCYKMTQLGVQKSAARGNLAQLVRQVASSGELDDAQFIEGLSHLATGLYLPVCNDAEDQEYCLSRATPTPTRRLELIKALDLILSLQE